MQPQRQDTGSGKAPRNPRAMKDVLKVRRTALQNLWRKGLSGSKLLAHHTHFIDSCLTDCLNNCPDQGHGMALVALGGYGRGELFPFSDIDLMLLHAPEISQEKVEKAAEAIFYPLWDAGFEVGHGVRTPKNCLVDSKKDFFLQSAILDARLVAGSEALFGELTTSFRENFIEGNRQQYLAEIINNRRNRHQRYGLHSYQLEPNIKECRGGFRDIHAMLWTAQVIFGLHNLAGIEETGLITKDERETFEAARNHLIRIRNRLHYISGRKNDQLFFEHQEDMANALGYKNDAAKLGVERFMRELYAHLQNIAILTDIFFEHVAEKVGNPPKKSGAKSLESGIEARNGRIHLTSPNLLGDKPALLMRLFRQAAKTGQPLHYRTRQAISANLHLVDERLRSSRSIGKAFMEILQSNTDSRPVLSHLLETGLLPAYIPEFANIQSLALHDIYHTSTVDHHLLQTVVELGHLRREQSTLFADIKSLRVLYLAAILHDIGKGYGHSHAERGAKTAKIIGKRLGLTQKENDNLVFLIKNHLFLSNAAMRRDLEDEQFIMQCACTINDQDRLNMLYLLSIADAKATGPTAWTDWKATLLMELFLKTGHLLDQSDLIDPDHGQAAEWMRNQVKQLLTSDADINLSDLPDEYLLNFTPKEIADHIKARQDLQVGKALLFPEKAHDHWSLLILSHDQPGLLSKICGILALHKFEVLGAQIHTWKDGTTIDVLDINPTFNSTITSEEWDLVGQDLNQALANRLGLIHRLSAMRRTSRPGPSQKLQAVGNKVVIDNDTSSLYTVIEVFALDKAALLFNITRTMADFGLNIHRAIISTQQEQLIDVFYVVDDQGAKIVDRNFSEEIRMALLHIASIN